MSRFIRQRRGYDDDSDDDDSGMEEEEEEEDDEEEEGENEEERYAGESESELESSSEALGPTDICAPFSELNTLLRELLKVSEGMGDASYEWIVNDLGSVLQKLKHWCFRALNDRDRNVSEPVETLAVQVEDIGSRVAETAGKLLFLLLDRASDDITCKALGNLLYVLDVVRSREEFRLEKLEAGEIDAYDAEYEEEDEDGKRQKVGEPELVHLWVWLDEHAEEALEKLTRCLINVTTPSLSSLSVSQVFVVDGIRNLMTKFMLNWMCRSFKETSLQHPFLGFPHPCPGFPSNADDLTKAFKDQATALALDRRSFETVIMKMPSPELQRSAFLFIEAFLYLLERDVLATLRLIEGEDDVSDVRAVGVFLRPCIESIVRSPNVDETTKLYALRAIDACPLIICVNNELPLDMMSDILNSSNDPVLLYQVSAALLAVVNVVRDRIDILPPELLNNVNPRIVCNSLFAASQKIRLLASSCSPADCFNTLMGIEAALDQMLGAWLDTVFDPAEMEQFFLSIVDLVNNRTKSVANPPACVYLNPTLAQRVSMSFSTSQLYDSANPNIGDLPAGLTTVSGHALYGRLIKLFVLLNDCILLNYVISETGVALADKADIQAFLWFGTILADDEYFAHLTHPRAVDLMEAFGDSMMDRIVNGGHLDHGASYTLKRADYYHKCHVMRWKVMVEYMNTFELVFGRRAGNMLTDEEWEKFIDLWAKLVTICPKDDPPEYLAMLKEESTSPMCAPATIHRLNDLLGSAATAFSQTLCNVQPLLELRRGYPVNPKVTDRIMLLAREVKLFSPDEIQQEVNPFFQKFVGVRRMNLLSVSRKIERRKSVVEALTELVLVSEGKDIASICKESSYLSVEIGFLGQHFRNLIAELPRECLRRWDRLLQFAASLMDFYAAVLVKAHVKISSIPNKKSPPPVARTVCLKLLDSTLPDLNAIVMSLKPFVGIQLRGPVWDDADLSAMVDRVGQFVYDALAICNLPWREEDRDDLRTNYPGKSEEEAKSIVVDEMRRLKLTVRPIAMALDNMMNEGLPMSDSVHIDMMAELTRPEPSSWQAKLTDAFVSVFNTLIGGGQEAPKK